MCADGTFPAEETIVICVKHAVVAQDLRDAMARHHPMAAIVMAQLMGPVPDALHSATRVSLAIIEAGPVQLWDSPLGAILEARGSRYLLLGRDAEEHGPVEGYATLTVPFSEASLEEALALVLA